MSREVLDSKDDNVGFSMKYQKINFLNKNLKIVLGIYVQGNIFGYKKILDFFGIVIEKNYFKDRYIEFYVNGFKKIKVFLNCLFYFF